MADSADQAQTEIEQAHQRQLERLKRDDVIASDECVECGAEIDEGRRKAIKTNLCIGCAEINELRSKNYAARR